MSVKLRKIYTLLPTIFQAIIYIIVRTIFTVFAGLTIVGARHIAKEKTPFIFAANHVSEWDGPLIRSCLPFFSKKWSPMYFVGMKENGYTFKDFGFRSIFYRGSFFKMLGAYPTFPGKHDYAKSLMWFSTILKKGKNICIFPEGRRSRLEGEFGEAKGGVGFLAISEGVPVVPVAIKGLAGKSLFDILFFRAKVTVVFGDPIAFNKHENPHIDVVRKASQKILTTIQDLYSSQQFAFLVHPRHHTDLKRKFPFLRFFPNVCIDLFAYLAPPVTVSEITGLYSKTGQPIRGHIVAITMTAKQMLKNRSAALKKIIQATRYAQKKDVGVIGFGALTASLTQGGLAVSPHVNNIGITTGRIYTVKTVSDYAKKCIAEFDFKPEKVRIAIVGAAGSIGSGCYDILQRFGVRNFTLIDLIRKHDQIKKYTENTEAAIVVSSDMSLLIDADIIIAATSAPDVVIHSEHLKPGAIVINDAQPSDISPELIDERKDILIIEGGVIYTEGVKCNFNLGLAGREDTFCCLGEVLILAHNKKFETFSLGYSDLNLIQVLEELEKTLSIKLSPFQNARGYIPQAQIDTVRSIIKSNR